MQNEISYLNKFFNKVNTIKNENALSKERAFDFSYLRKVVIPKWKANNKNIQKPFLAWNCQNESGLNTLSLSSLLQSENLNFKILATDTSDVSIQKTKNGVYRKTQTDLLSFDVKNFILMGQNEVEGWIKFKDDVYQKIQFQQHDLTSANYLAQDLFDLILAEDLISYYSITENYEVILTKLHRSLKPAGVLMAESALRIPNFSEYFSVVAPGVYRKL